MATHNTLNSLFTAIANAIRAKTGGSSTIVADNFPTAISNLPVPSGNAVAGDVLSGKTFSNSSGSSTGIMTNRGNVHYTIDRVDGEIVIPEGYHGGNGWVDIDSTEAAKIIPGNIKKDVTILGVTGTHEGGGGSVEDFNGDLLCFTATQASSTITLTKRGSPSWTGSYSLDKANWVAYTPETWVSGQTSYTNTITLANVGDKIYFKGNLTADNTTSDSLRFVMTGKIKASGNVMSLTYSDRFAMQLSIDRNYMFYGLFSGCTSLTMAPELPAITLKTGCYALMFYNCTSLTVPPELPGIITPSSSYVYQSMFNNCTSMKVAVPITSAGTLPYYCCNSMFSNCSRLGLATSNESMIHSTRYTIPMIGSSSDVASSMSLNNMFSGNSCSVSTPSLNVTYYVANRCAVVHDSEEVFSINTAQSQQFAEAYYSVTYNGETIYNSNGCKVITLKCKGQKMLSDLTFSIKANSTVIASGTYSCANMTMKTDLKIYFG